MTRIADEGRAQADRLDALDALLARAREEHAILDFPERPWVLPHHSEDGQRILNVLVVGAGQSGISILATLARDHVDGILAIDAAARDQEGPWREVARMNVLRTPKQLTGPDAGIPSLSFARWYKTRYGELAWENLDQIPRLEWSRYLSFVRDAYNLPIRNGVRLDRIVPQGKYLAAQVTNQFGQETLLARKIVLATGIDGGGGWYVPEHVTALPRAMWAHTSEPIPFVALKGKRVAVLGAGASAMDNAAEALEAGAAAVEQFCRRPLLQPIQPLAWTGFAGFMRHIGDMDDAWRWRFMAYVLGLREPFTKDAWGRVSRFSNYKLRVGETCKPLVMEGNHIMVRTRTGDQAFDFLICGTGIEIDHRLRPELQYFANDIARWQDRYTPPPEEADERLANFPYLSRTFAFCERTTGSAPQLANIHCFNFAATMSFGPSGAAIRPLRYAVPSLTQALTRDLFRDDIAFYWDDLRAFNGTEFGGYPVRLSAPDFRGDPRVAVRK
jgi:cation diffusion facilitator CzcD-associated flavoprotein CzcO